MRIESEHVLPGTKHAAPQPGGRYEITVDGAKPPHLIFAADEETGEVLAHEVLPGIGPKMVDGKPTMIRLTGKVQIKLLPEPAAA